MIRQTIFYFFDNTCTSGHLRVIFVDMSWSSNLRVKHGKDCCKYSVHLKTIPLAVVHLKSQGWGFSIICLFPRGQEVCSLFDPGGGEFAIGDVQS